MLRYSVIYYVARTSLLRKYYNLLRSSYLATTQILQIQHKQTPKELKTIL